MLYISTQFLRNSCPDAPRNVTYFLELLFEICSLILYKWLYFLRLQMACPLQGLAISFPLPLVSRDTGGVGSIIISVTARVTFSVLWVHFWLYLLENTLQTISGSLQRMLFQIMRYTGCTVLYSIFIWHVLRPAIKSGVFSSYSTSGDFFVLRPLCYLEERLAAGCMAPSMSDTARDISQCAITCLSDGSCVGCSRAQPDGKLYQHWPCDRVFPVCQDGNAEMQ